MWGCFLLLVFYQVDHKVFPTHVGVFPLSFRSDDRPFRLPHACGGVSGNITVTGAETESSPRMWGCFSFHAVGNARRVVFPTHVGVFLGRKPRLQVGVRLPHACGGVSSDGRHHRQSDLSSPRMWGCFSNSIRGRLRWYVFPTHVGVFPSSRRRKEPTNGLPHACGGVSEFSDSVAANDPSSPRMWGCFRFRLRCDHFAAVFPTHVGVFPISISFTSLVMCLPHACGGVSRIRKFSLMVLSSSPRMWGCFYIRAFLSRFRFVFPTHVGVFLKEAAN